MLVLERDRRLAADELAILDADIQLRRDVGAHPEEEVELVDGGDIAVGLAVARVQIDPGSAMEGDAARRYRDKAVEDLDRGARGGDHQDARRNIIIPYRNIDEARSEEHTSELQSIIRISYAVFCLKNNN